MSTLTEFEPFVDKTIATLFKRLDEFVIKDQVCDIAVWLQYCTRFCIDTFLACTGPFVISVLTSSDAFDVIGELTFSKPLGFLEKGVDVDGIIVALEQMLDYSGKVRRLNILRV